MFCDYHVHSCFSDDSSYPTEKVVKDAIAAGMEEICFTEHVDYGVKTDWPAEESRPSVLRRIPVPVLPGQEVKNADYPRYFAELDRLSRLYGEKIRIKKGLEFGVQTHTIPAFTKLFLDWPLDFVILSIHQVGNLEFWDGSFQKGHTDQECYEVYYQEMLDVVTAFPHYCVLGHMDLLKRYDSHSGYDGFVHHRDMIERILRRVIADGKGIELNTSSIRYGLDSLMPDRRILEMYRELGGRVLTVGSDSHKKEHLGAYIKEMKPILSEIGFKEFCTFTKMEPEFHPLSRL